MLQIFPKQLLKKPTLFGFFHIDPSNQSTGSAANKSPFQFPKKLNNSKFYGTFVHPKNIVMYLCGQFHILQNHLLSRENAKQRKKCQRKKKEKGI